MAQQRITDTSKKLMIGMAVFFDVMQGVTGFFNLIPGIGNILALVLGYAFTILANLTFYTWFASKGISFTKGKKKGWRILALVSEYFPFTSVLPGWTIAVSLTIKMIQSEDRE